MHTINRKSMTAMLLAAILCFTLLAACNKEEEPSYTGEFDVSYNLPDPFTTNVNGEKKTVLRYTISLTLTRDSDALIASLDTKLSAVRDEIIKIGRMKTMEDIQKPDAQSIMAAEITAALNSYFNTDKFTGVVFNEFFWN